MAKVVSGKCLIGQIARGKLQWGELNWGRCPVPIQTTTDNCIIDDFDDARFVDIMAQVVVPWEELRTTMAWVPAGGRGWGQ